MCLAHPIHCRVPSTLTYGPNSKWMGTHCGVHGRFLTARHQPSLGEEGLIFCGFGTRISPKLDHVSAQGMCLAHPIHCRVPSTLTYGPNSKWMGTHCGVHGRFTARHQPSLGQEGLIFCGFGTRISPKLGHISAQGMCLAHPIHCRVPSTLTYGPNSN